jgi:hypothetical protein
MTTVSEVLAARLMGGLPNDDVVQVNGKTFVRITELQVTRDGVTVVAAGGLNCSVPIINMESALANGAAVYITLPSAFIEATLK